MQGRQLHFRQNPDELLLAASEPLRGTRAAHRQDGLHESPERIDLRRRDPIRSQTGQVSGRGARTVELPKIERRKKPLRNFPRRDPNPPTRTTTGGARARPHFAGRDVTRQ